MKNMTRLFLIILTYAPIKTVAVAAQSKISEMAGEGQHAVLMKAVKNARYRILPDGHTFISLEDSKKRYAELTGLHGLELQQQMKRDVQLLVNHNLLQVNEKFAMSQGPSRWAL